MLYNLHNIYQDNILINSIRLVINNNNNNNNNTAFATNIIERQPIINDNPLMVS